MGKEKFVYKPSRFMLPTSRYSKELADHAVDFIQSLCHTKGEWDNKPFLLLPWQEQIIRDLFGIIKADGNRQFNIAYIECPKKTGKSELAAAVALYTLIADGEPMAEVYGAAANRDQAAIVFDVARAMVQKSPTLSKVTKIVPSEKKILFLPTNSFYSVVAAEAHSKHGYNTHAVIFDELHAQPDRKFFDVMLFGSGNARRNPLFFLITTAGSDRYSICFEQHKKAKEIIKGKLHDPSFYPVIYAAEESEDWTSEAVWAKANPSLGVTVKIDKFRIACESAKANPAEENLFRQFYLSQWTKQSVRWMPMDKWNKCGTTFDIRELEGRTCYAGLDLSSTTDITAFVLVFPPDGDNDKYIVLPYFWLPEDTLELRVRRDKVPYDLWAKAGSVFITEGNVVNYDDVEKFIDITRQKYDLREVAFDRWNATHITQRLKENSGANFIDFGQGYVSMSNPAKQLMKLVLEEKIAHGGNEPLSWMADNVTISTDPAGNIKPNKQKSTEKIDGIVALIMALDSALKGGGGAQESIYNTRDLLVLG